MQYNELMTEGIAVLYAAPPPVATSAAAINLYPTGLGINVKSIRRLIIDVNVGSSVTVGLTSLKYCPLANGTYSSAISLPSAIASGAGPGSPGLVRFEFSEDYLATLIAAQSGGVVGSGTGAPGVWLQFQVTPSATGFVSAVVYGVAGYYPSADNTVNGFLTSISTTSGCPVTSQYVDGVIGSTPANQVVQQSNPLLNTNLVLPA